MGLKRRVAGPVEGFDELDTMDQLDQWLPRADVVALSLPPHPGDGGADGRGAASRRMREDAILLNAGRGSVLDQEALARVMGEGRLWGGRSGRHCAGAPPPPTAPCGTSPTCCSPPHVAGGMRLEITRKACVQMAQDNLRRYLAGEPLVNRVN